MMIECMWCKTKFIYRYDDMRISYGLCEDCIYSDNFHMSGQLTDYLESLTQPVIAINRDLVFQFANKKALQFLDKIDSEISEKYVGNIFDCINTQNSITCGKTNNCHECNFVKTVEETYSQNKMMIYTFVTASKRKNNIFNMYKIMLSTEKAGDIILLRIDATLPFNSENLINR